MIDSILSLSKQLHDKSIDFSYKYVYIYLFIYLYNKVKHFELINEIITIEFQPNTKLLESFPIVFMGIIKHGFFVLFCFTSDIKVLVVYFFTTTFKADKKTLTTFDTDMFFLNGLLLSFFLCFFFSVRFLLKPSSKM